MERASERLEWIDVLKGLGIILVVLNHRPVPTTYGKFIAAFHMPLFFFISGYLFRDRPFRQFLKSRAKSLLIPYLCFSLLSMLIWAFSAQYLYNIPLKDLGNVLTKFLYLKGEVAWNGPLWFLVVLFLVEIAYFTINRLTASGYILGGLILVSSVIGYAISVTLSYRLPFGTDIVFTALVFYGVGNLVRRNNMSVSNPDFRFVLLVLGIALTLIASHYNTAVNVSMVRFGNYFEFYIGAFSGILTLIIVSKLFSNVRILQYFGQNTIVLIVTQLIDFWILDFMRQAFGITEHIPIYFETVLYTGFALLMSIPSIYFINKYLPFVIGKSSSKQPNQKINTPVQKGKILDIAR